MTVDKDVKDPLAPDLDSTKPLTYSKRHLDIPPTDGNTPSALNPTSAAPKFGTPADGLSPT